jgi:hypothetical protein
LSRPSGGRIVKFVVFARIVRRLREFLPVYGLLMQWRKSS